MSAIVKAIENLAEAAPDAFAVLVPFLKDAATTVLLPILVGIFCAVSALRVLQILHRIVYPPNAKQLHKEALACLKKGDDAPTRKQGKKLLRRAITKDPKFLPARLTLIAIQLYQEQNYQDASTTIQEAQAIFPGNKELKNMELDAMAMKSNLAHMVLAGSFATMYLGDYTSRYRRR
jgi:tetratricopeptide (TPR) repeat protein